MDRPRALASLPLAALLVAIAPLACSGGSDDDTGATASTSGTTDASASGPSPTSGASTSTSTAASTDTSTTGGTTEATSTTSATEPGTSTGVAETDTATSDTSSTTDTSTSDTSSTTDTGSTGTTTDTSGGTDTGVDEPPTVISTAPDELAEGVAADTAIAVTFSEVMDPATLTTNTADTSCSGTLQVSFDQFKTCVKMAAPPSSGDELTFTVKPAAPLGSATTYKIRVLADVTDMGGTAMAADFTSADGFTIRYFHTIVLDGVNDFTVNETFASSTLGQSGFVAWDADYLYLGMKSPDLAAQSSQVWMVAYLGGMMGSSVGVLYNTQQPNLPFDARWHLRWKASDDYGGALEWSGGAWSAVGFGPIAGGDDVATADDFVEMRVSWADLQSPDMIEVHLGMLREQPLSEATWAGVPANSYMDGYDPDYAHYFNFDVLGSLTPAAHESL
ncbi:MAG: Ig-like domain-containing protein [Myxococcales bacterium]|nr:Ig-like domain-containing protein [Myxococcales bacterium]